MRLTPAHSAEKTRSSAKSSASGTAKDVERRSLVVPGFILPLPPLPSAVPSDVSGKSASKPKRTTTSTASLFGTHYHLSRLFHCSCVFICISLVSRSFSKKYLFRQKKESSNVSSSYFQKNISSKIDIIIIYI